jgi:hypothetical protein
VWTALLGEPMEVLGPPALAEAASQLASQLTGATE